MRKALTIAYILLLAILFSGLINSAFAAVPKPNVFWLSIKPKLVKHLNNFIDKSKYTYEIIGPTRELTSFLGNRPNAPITFSKLNLASKSLRKNIIARSGADQVPIGINVWQYKDVMAVNKAISKGEEFTEEHITSKRIPIIPSDERLYYQGNPINKVATQDLAKGTPLKVTMLRKEKLIKAGDSVHVVSESSFVKLEFRCHAVNSGDVNDIISLYCPEMANTSPKAVVIARGKAKLR